ncbi:hypothetical protein [Catenulispora subtropica]|uniref:Uncharacterized protein n=1 Tax=Catenulispora subtropica TaxID=450798 RepID=A0ABP5D398_9ACTN
MNLDETLAEAMQRTAHRIAVNPSPTAETVRRGLVARRRRRTATTALAVAAVGAIGAIGIPDWSARSHSASPGQQPAATRTIDTQSARDTVTTVAAGEHVTMPSGAELWLSSQGLSLALGTGHQQSDTVPVPDPSTAPVTAVARTVGSTTLWAGIYHGPGTPATVTLTFGGRSVPAKVLTLPGSPGWMAFAAEAAGSDTGTDKPVLSAYSADGTKLLAIRV